MTQDFHNLEATELNPFPRVLKWALTRRPARWPRWVESTVGQTPPPRVTGTVLRATLVNHATVLIQSGGLNLLTDPHWGRRCSPVSFAGPKRVRAPGLALEQMPQLDAILLSHNHYDHMDLGTLERLFSDHTQAPLITGLGVARSLPKRWRARAIELDWWAAAELPGGVRVTYTPSRHFSARGLFDRWRSLWGGFHIALAGGIYFAGDTGYGRHFQWIRERLGPVRLALLPIGAYEPRWFMKDHHMDPFDAVAAYKDLGAAHALAMHYGTFQLADEPYDQPLEALEGARKAADLVEDRFLAMDFGRGWNVPA